MGQSEQGAQLFAEQLRRRAIDAHVQDDWVEFDFEVPGGTYCGQAVRLAVQVPNDFPSSSPSGIDFKPRLRPVHPSGEHPQRSHVSRRYGPDGEYWSRPFKGWNKERSRDASTYLAWVLHLWMTT